MHEKTKQKIVQISFASVFFLTPLLFFTHSHDQFELSKLTFMALMAAPLLFLLIQAKNTVQHGFMTLFLLLFVATQVLACLPAISLSWQTSLFGDYENFAGLYTLFTYLAWYLVFTQFLNPFLIRRVFYFVVLSGFLSSLYAIAQHFQFDFVQWDPNSVNSTREFAALGNPNFLSAYIAMSIPLFLTLTFEEQEPTTAQKSSFSIASLMLPMIGLALLFLATVKGQYFFQLTPSEWMSFTLRILGLFCLCLFCIRASQNQTLFLRIFVGIVLLLGLLSTASRGGFLAALFGAALWLFLAFKNSNWRDRCREAWLKLPKLPFVTAILAIGLFLLFFGWSFLQRLGNSVLHIPESLAVSRLHIWKPALAIVQANPFFGVGLDTFKIAFPRYSGIEFNQIDGLFTSSRMAHNELLQIVATSGLIGLAAYLGLLLCFLILWVKSYKKASANTRWILIAVLASAFAYQIQNFFSFGVSSLNLIWFFLLAVIGNLEKKSTEDVETSSNPVPFKIFYRSIAFIFIVLLLLLPIRRLAADIAFSKGNDYSAALKSRNSQTSAEAINYYSTNQIHYLERALALFPWDVKYTLYTGLAHEEKARAIPAQAANEFSTALLYYQKAVQMSPANAYYYNDEGRIYSALAPAIPQLWTKAENAYRQSVYWSPSSPFFLLNWVSALEKTGQTEEARKQTENAFKSDPTFSAKILSQMAFDEYRAGDKITAFRHINEAIQGNPSSPEAYYCLGIIYLSENQRKKALENFEKVDSLHPDPYKDPSIQKLDQLIEESKK